MASCRRIAELVAASSDHEPVRGAAVSRALDRIIRVGDGMHTCLVSKADVELRLVCHSRGRLTTSCLFPALPISEMWSGFALRLRRLFSSVSVNIMAKY